MARDFKFLPEGIETPLMGQYSIHASNQNPDQSPASLDHEFNLTYDCTNAQPKAPLGVDSSSFDIFQTRFFELRH